MIFQSSWCSALYANFKWSERLYWYGDTQVAILQYFVKVCLDRPLGWVFINNCMNSFFLSRFIIITGRVRVVVVEKPGKFAVTSLRSSHEFPGFHYYRLTNAPVSLYWPTKTITDLLIVVWCESHTKVTDIGHTRGSRIARLYVHLRLLLTWRYTSCYSSIFLQSMPWQAAWVHECFRRAQWFLHWTRRVEYLVTPVQCTCSVLYFICFLFVADATDIVADGFYDVGRLKLGQPFMPIEWYCNEPVNSKRPVLYVSIQPSTYVYRFTCIQVYLCVY